MIHLTGSFNLNFNTNVDVEMEICHHPFLKKQKCLFCGTKISKALREQRDKEEYEQEEYA